MIPTVAISPDSSISPPFKLENFDQHTIFVWGRKGNDLARRGGGLDNPAVAETVFKVCRCPCTPKDYRFDPEVDSMDFHNAENRQRPYRTIMRHIKDP
ncbi:hypothetical protein TNCV_3661101 [Trichonephila clavipes]|nr:hypothetical protein TNCV_3661101 [Trichonephila clavipes]